MTATAPSTMTVGELARRTGVSANSLRDYTDWGLINSLGRTGANYRLYDTQALRCVQLITEMRGLGLTLAEIRWLASSYPDENGQLIGPRVGAAAARRSRPGREADGTAGGDARAHRPFEATHRAALGHRMLVGVARADHRASCA